MGDFVKGRPEGRYAQGIAEGIRFHRRIDSFCDAHPVTGFSRNRITSQRRRFAGIIVDVCYDIHLQGVAAALDRIAGRLGRGERFMSAVTEIESNYETLEKDFLSFFPDLVEFSRSRP